MKPTQKILGAAQLPSLALALLGIGGVLVFTASQDWSAVRPPADGSPGSAESVASTDPVAARLMAEEDESAEDPTERPPPVSGEALPEELEEEEAFVPSEQISADAEVAFPVDI